VCGDPLAPTGTATLTLAGLPPGALGFLFFGLDAAPASTHGGVFVPLPVLGLAVLVDGDLDGEISFPVDGGRSDVPVSLVLQFVYPDASLLPYGYGFTNAVELQFLGE